VLDYENEREFSRKEQVGHGTMTLKTKVPEDFF